MNLTEKLNQNLKEAMKSGDGDKVSVLRMLNASLKNKQIEKGKDAELDDNDVLQVLTKEAKKRKESAEAFDKGNRPELAEKEKKELAILEEYLPKQMVKEEVEKEVERILAGIEDKSNVGMVMKAVMGELKGKADGKTISGIVKEKLS